MLISNPLSFMLVCNQCVKFSNRRFDPIICIDSLIILTMQAVETSQTQADCQCRLDRINGQIEELQRAVREKASAVEQENHKFRRAQVGINWSKLNRQ